MKTKALTKLLLAAAILCAGASCTGNLAKEIKEKVDNDRPRYLQDSEKWGKVVEKTIEAADFQSISASGSADIIFVQSDTASLRVEGNEKVLETYEISTKGGRLSVEHKGDLILASMPFIRIYASAPSLEKIELNGEGDIEINDSVKLAGNLDIDITGMGDVEIEDLACKGLRLSISGMGDMELRQAKCETAEFALSGMGDIDVESMACTGDAVCNLSGNGDISAALACRNLDVTVGGIGSAKIDVHCENIRATASGTGDLELKGKAKKLTKQERALSKIRTKKLEVDNIEY